jgi:hypothetical protein
MPDKQTSGENNQAAGNRSREFASADELVGFAQSYFSNDFQNPEQLDCPSPATLRAYARSGKLPDESLRKHLFGCSECFREYRATLRSQPASAILQPGLSWSQRLLQNLALRKAPLLAGALSLLFACLIGAYLWRQSRQESTARNVVNKSPAAATATGAKPVPAAAPPTIETQTPPPSPANQLPEGAVNRAVDSNKQKPTRTRPSRPGTQAAPRPATRPAAAEPHELARLASVRIDLDEFTATRGVEANAAGQRPIKLARSRQRLLLVLPEGSIKGLYEISILAPSGEALVAAKARSRDGKIIEAIINTQQLAPGRYSLRITPPGEGADLYPLVISDEKNVQ